jgi:hypothetical protein
MIYWEMGIVKECLSSALNDTLFIGEHSLKILYRGRKEYG